MNQEENLKTDDDGKLSFVLGEQTVCMKLRVMTVI